MTDVSYPNAVPTPGGPSTPASRSGCDKLLVGCGLGCGLLIITFGVFAVVAGLWATRPGTQHETTAAVSPEGVAVVKLRDIGEDPGTQEFFTNFLQTINEASRQAQKDDLPENLRWIADLQGNNASPAGINMFLPKDLTISFEPRDPAELAALEKPTEDDELAVVVAVNFRSFVRPIKAFITWAVEQDATAPVRQHGDHRLLPMDDVWATFVDGTLFASNSYAALEAALDRLDRGTIERTWSGEVPEGDWDFFGVVDQGADAVQVVFDKLRKKNTEVEAEIAVRIAEDPDDIVQLAFGVDLKSADALEAELLYTLADQRAATRYAAYLEEEMEQLRIRGTTEGLNVETSVVQDADQVTAKLAVTGMRDKVAQMADWLMTMDDEVERVIREVEESVQDSGTN